MVFEYSLAGLVTAGLIIYLIYALLMTVIGWVQILLYYVIIFAITPVLDAYMTRVFGGERTFLPPILRSVEVAIYKLAGVDERQEQHALTALVVPEVLFGGNWEGFAFWRQWPRTLIKIKSLRCHSH
jgi:Potassium-transporting ATPase A subunit